MIGRYLHIAQKGHPRAHQGMTVNNVNSCEILGNGYTNTVLNTANNSKKCIRRVEKSLCVVLIEKSILMNPSRKSSGREALCEARIHQRAHPPSPLPRTYTRHRQNWQWGTRRTTSTPALQYS
jgi:hypothetical protein